MPAFQRIASSAAVRTALVVLLFFLAPTATLVLLAHAAPVALDVTHFAVATAYLLTAGLMLLEVRSAVRRRQAPLPPRTGAGTGGRPLVTLLVAAYLPNEREVIVDTIQHLTTQLDNPSYSTEVLLAYNARHEDVDDIERELAELSKFNSSFTSFRVEGSSSKAENIVAALPRVRGEVTVVLDADHHLHPQAIERALRWFELGYDVVQGRCVVRNQRENWLTRLVTCEFEHIYAVMHTGRSVLFGTALFGGSNGYWRTDVLRRVGMDDRMLTEDIDATVRATLAGVRIVHDRSVISSELAPTTAGAWWTQRLRWAQGWLQVTVRHQPEILRSDGLDSTTKWCWTYLLAWRELFAPLSMLAPAVVIAGLVAGLPMHLGDPYLLATSAVTMTSGIASGAAAYRLARAGTRERMRRDFIVYALAAWPYTLVKNFVALTGMVREVLGVRNWVVTKRAAPAREPVTETA
jgi:cellulose synthase/poly-beta-1,6-N-acetylglucosamine synthase-like glycosyltransferase